MATYITKTSGNLTDSTTWNTATGFSGYSANNQQLTDTSYHYSPTFTGVSDTIDGVLFSSRPLNATDAADLTVQLYNVTDSVEVASIAIPILSISTLTTQSLALAKFASTYTLDTAKTYKIGFKSSVANKIYVYKSSATTDDFMRALRTTAEAAPWAGDNIYIVSEFNASGLSEGITVTMNQTATTQYSTVYIGTQATFAYGYAASTNYIFKTNSDMYHYTGSNLTIGTVANPIPSTSTATLFFATASDNGAGFIGLGTCSVIMQGASKASVITTISSDAAASQAVVNVASTSGWAATDDVILTSTNRVVAQSEKKIISSVGSSTQITLTTNLSYIHHGTSPLVGKVGNLTRNVIVQGNGAALRYKVNGTGYFTVDFDYVRFYQSYSWTFGSAAAQNIQYCVFDDSYNGVNLTSNTATTTFSNNIVYSSANGLCTISASWPIVAENNIFCKCTGSSDGVQLSAVTDLTFNNNDISSGWRYGFYVVFYSGIRIISMTGNEIHANPSGWLYFAYSNPSTATWGYGLMENNNVWRNVSEGIGIQYGMSGFTFKGWNIFGNGTNNLNIATAYSVYDTHFINCTFNGDSTYSTTTGVNMTGNGLVMVDVFFENCNFSTASGIKTAHTNDFAFVNQHIRAKITLRNTILAAATEVSGITGANIKDDTCIAFQRVDGTAGTHKIIYKNGTVQKDSSVYRTAAPSEKMSPLSATVKIASGTRKTAIDSATTKTVNVYVRESVAWDGTDYNGNRPRLICKVNYAAGMTADVVLDTATASAEGAWELLTWTSPTITDDAVLEFYVDCDGTTGWVHVDDWSITA